MTARFEVRPLQNGRHYEIDALRPGRTDTHLALTRLEATDLRDALTRVLGGRQGCCRRGCVVVGSHRRRCGMTGPEIPDEAIEAAFKVLGMSRLDIETMLAAAAPHLVAAATAAERERIATAIEVHAADAGRMFIEGVHSRCLLDAAAVARREPA